MQLRKVILLALVITACTEQVEIQPNDLLIVDPPQISEVDAEGALFDSKVNNIDLAAVEDHGFIWSTNVNPTFDNSETKNLGTPSVSTFESSIESRLMDGQKYYVRAFIKSNGFSSLSDTTSFTSFGSKGPILTSFSPSRGHLSDTLTLRGNNFSSQLNNKVFFGDRQAQIVSHFSDSLLVKVPILLNSSSSIRVLVSSEASSFDQDFELIEPKIDDLSTYEVGYGDTIIIQTEEYPNAKELISIYLENEQLERKEVRKESTKLDPLRFVLENEVSFSSFKVVLAFNNQESTSSQTIRLVNPQVDRVSSRELTYGQKVRLYGSGFSPLRGSNKVWLDTLSAKVTETGTEVVSGIQYDFVEFEVPAPINGAYSSREIGYRLQVLDFELTNENQFEIIDPWFRLDNAPFDQVEKSFNSGSTGFIYSEQKLWSFAQGSWKQLADFPGEGRNKPSGFLLNNSIYVGLGRKTTSSNSFLSDFWIYNILNNSWSRLGDFSGNPRWLTLDFSLNESGYIGIGRGRFFSRSKDFWRYNPTNDSWSQISDYPFISHSGFSATNSDGTFAGLTEGSSSSNIYRYNDIANNWTVINQFPFNGNLTNMQFVAASGFIYAGLVGDSNTLYRLDTNNSAAQWQTISDSPISGKALFYIENKLYILSGNQIWEFDPER